MSRHPTPRDFSWVRTGADLGEAFSRLHEERGGTVSRGRLAKLVGVRVSTISNWLQGMVPRDRDKVRLFLETLRVGEAETRQLLAALDRLHDERRLLTRDRADETSWVTLAPPLGALPVVRGRDSLLSTVAAAGPGELHVLAGMGGVGKSTVAAALAERHRASGTSVWWISATDAMALSSGMLTLAKHLGASDAELSRARESVVVAADLCWTLLDAQPGPWVLCVDNADDVDALAPEGTSLPDGTGWLRSGRRGVVVVTSRLTDAATWGRRARVHQVGPVDSSAGADIVLDLISGSHDDATRRHARALSERAGNLPLALYLAGSYLGSGVSGVSLAELVAQADHGALVPVLDRAAVTTGRPLDPRQRLSTTWQASLTTLSRLGAPDAVDVLGVLAHFAPGRPIGVELLDRETLIAHGVIGSGPDALFTALVGLKRVGLLTQAVGGGVVVHPLVAEAVLLGNSRRPGLATAAAATLAVTTKADDGAGVERGEEACLLLVSHVEALLAHATGLGEEFASNAARAAYSAGWALMELHTNYAAVDEFLRRATAATEILGENDQQVLELHEAYGFLQVQRGRHADAERTLRPTLDRMTQSLSDDTKSVLNAMAHLALALSGQAKHDEALPLFEKAVSAVASAVGSTHKRTLVVRNNYAVALYQANRMRDAETEMRVLADSYQAAFGADHAYTMTARYNHAMALGRLGRLDESERALRTVLADRTRSLGSRHPDTLYAQNGLGAVLVERGEFAEADVLLSEVLRVREEILDAEHPHLRTTRELLTRCRQGTGGG